MTYRIVESFLSGGDEWKTLGRDTSQNPVLAKYAGALFRLYDARNQPLDYTPLRFTNGELSGAMLYNPDGGGYFGDLLPSGAYTVKTASEAFPANLNGGGYFAVTLKSGPFIRTVTPSECCSDSLQLSSGMRADVKGVNLQDATVFVGDLATEIVSASPERVEIVIPDGLKGLVRLRLENGAGVAETRILVNYR